MAKAQRLFVLASMIGLVAACAHRANPPPYHWPEARSAKTLGANLRLSDADIESVVREVSVARQITPTRPVAVVRVDHARFVEHLLHDGDTNPNTQTAVNGERLTPEAALLLGFDFVPPPGQRGGIASTDELLEEQVAGYYDLRTDQVFLPDTPLRTQDELREQRAVLAHEVQHALQAQRFGHLEEKAPRSSDAQLARLALIEGDAMVAMGAAMGAVAGAPVGRTLRRIVEETKKVPLATVTRGEHRQKLDAALELTRKRLLFPYQDGMLFVSDVYRAGGFPLVDRIYERPPTTTAQILHPEKYLAGETAHVVRDPEPPAGYASTSVDTLGELATKVLLSRCLSASQAEEAAAGWAGDRYGVFTSSAGKLAVLWASTWETEHDAVQVEDALAKSAACWHDNSLGEGGDAGNDVVIGADILVRRRGKIVAFERGLPATMRERELDRLFPLVGAEPPRVPLTDLHIPPRVPLKEPTPGSLHADVYEDSWLGVTGRVPPGMIGTAGTQGTQLLVSRPDLLARGVLSFSGRLTTDAQNEITFSEVSSGLALEAAKFGAGTSLVDATTTETPLGRGLARTWRVNGAPISERVVLIPICAGTGSIAFVEIYGDEFARSLLETWIGSFRWQHGRSIAACDYLDPK